MKVYLVGGAVRDKLLGKESRDKDYVIVGATEKDVQSLIDQGYEQVGSSFPVFLHPETKDEYALARTERKTGVGYNGFSCNVDPSVTLEDDLKRRDLTINSMAYDEESDTLIDPFDGRKDLEDKVLRNTSEAFREDPMRVLRVARFRCKFPEFTIHQDLKDEIMFLNRHPDEFKSIPVESIKKEIKKTWEYEKPSMFFDTLNEIGSLKDFFPRIAKLRGVDQSPVYHPEGDAYIHTMLVYDNIIKLTNKEKCIFACLVHDLGKGETPKEELPKHILHEERGIPLVEEFSDRFKFSSHDSNFIKKFTEYHLKIHRSIEMSPRKIVKLFTDLGITSSKDEMLSKLEDYLLCAKADSLGKNNTIYKQEKFLLECAKACLSYDKKKIYMDLKSRDKLNILHSEIHQEKVSLLKKNLKNIRTTCNL